MYELIDKDKKVYYVQRNPDSCDIDYSHCESWEEAVKEIRSDGIDDLTDEQLYRSLLIKQAEEDALFGTPTFPIDGGGDDDKFGVDKEEEIPVYTDEEREELRERAAIEYLYAYTPEEVLEIANGEDGEFPEDLCWVEEVEEVDEDEDE
jgi:hypothetical protein